MVNFSILRLIWVCPETADTHWRLTLAK